MHSCVGVLVVVAHPPVTNISLHYKILFFPLSVFLIQPRNKQMKVDFCFGFISD